MDAELADYFIVSLGYLILFYPLVQIKEEKSCGLSESPVNKQEFWN